MRCNNTTECFEQINAYFNGKKTGHFLLVNTDNYDVYQEILQRLETDISKRCIYVSQNCNPNGLPNVDTVISIAKNKGNYVLVGLSQAQMLYGNNELDAKLDEILDYSISGYGLILLNHCKQILEKFIHRDVRVKNRVILVDGNDSPKPQIKLIKTIEENIEFEPPLSDIPNLLNYLERLTNKQCQEHSSVTVISSLPIDTFRNSVYSVTVSEGIYGVLIGKYKDIAEATKKEYGTDEQWGWLAHKMADKISFSALVCDEFGSISNLTAHLSSVWKNGNKNKRWFLWLSLKFFGEVNNEYLKLVLGKCNDVDSFEMHAYMELANVDRYYSEFERYYRERKELLALLPINLSLIGKYCNKLGRHKKNEVFYLTDSSEQEKHNFLRCISSHDYTPEEIIGAVRNMSINLDMYMQDFIFNDLNTKLPEPDRSFRNDLTTYFKNYKLQKLTNRIFPEFIERVNTYAISPRPYNKLQPRSSIISHMDKKNAQCFFFDALGVEYLAFITEKCKEYGLAMEVAVGHCELPSITVKNKEFLQYFADQDYKKIDDLDKIKHHSRKYDYQKCKYPIHLFEELEVIDRELRNIHAMLVQGVMEKALIVADHGASRLAVLYGHELSSGIELDGTGEHSGRCCPAAEDPKLSFAAYEDGFAVLANYDRFKGGRRANVEVHGGASLEEVVVPVIILTKCLDNIEFRFLKDIIELKPGVIPELELFSGIPLNMPRLYINGDCYEGKFTMEDKRYVKFELTKIKRSGSYTVSIYDGNKDMSAKLEFKAQKQTREVDLFKSE